MILRIPSIRLAVGLMLAAGAPTFTQAQQAAPLRVAAAPERRSAAQTPPELASVFAHAGATRWGAVRHGAVVGAVVGASVGALAGIAARCGALKDPIDGDCLRVSSAAAIGGGLGAVAGALVGAITRAAAVRAARGT